MNEHSSRSHAILIVTVECSSAALADDGKEHIRVGKLNLVDLAGSERQSKTGSEGERFKEATKMCVACHLVFVRVPFAPPYQIACMCSLCSHVNIVRAVTSRCQRSAT